MTAQNYVLRSIYVEPEFDNYLREKAFTQNISKNDLMRKYLELGAQLHLATGGGLPFTGKTHIRLEPDGTLKLVSANAFPGHSKAAGSKAAVVRRPAKKAAAKKVAAKKVAAKKATAKKSK